MDLSLLRFVGPILMLAVLVFVGTNKTLEPYLRYVSLFRIAIMLIVALALGAFVVHLLIDEKKPEQTKRDLIILLVLFIIILFALGWAYIVLQ